MITSRIVFIFCSNSFTLLLYALFKPAGLASYHSALNDWPVANIISLITYHSHRWKERHQWWAWSVRENRLHAAIGQLIQLFRSFPNCYQPKSRSVPSPNNLPDHCIQVANSKKCFARPLWNQPEDSTNEAFVHLECGNDDKMRTHPGLEMTTEMAYPIRAFSLRCMCIHGRPNWVLTPKLGQCLDGLASLLTSYSDANAGAIAITLSTSLHPPPPPVTHKPGDLSRSSRGEPTRDRSNMDPNDNNNPLTDIWSASSKDSGLHTSRRPVTRPCARWARMGNASMSGHLLPGESGRRPWAWVCAMTLKYVCTCVYLCQQGTLRDGITTPRWPTKFNINWSIDRRLILTRPWPDSMPYNGHDLLR